MNLYEISKEIERCVDSETGEILQEELLDKLEMVESQKIENIALWIKNLKAEEEILKTEEQSFKERREKVKKKKELLTKYLQNYLCGRKFKSSKVEIGYRKSTSLEITDEEKFISFCKNNNLNHLLIYKITPAKAEVAKLLKQEQIVPFAKVIEKNNMNIK